MVKPFIQDPIERFFSNVEFEPNSGCWLWSGGGVHMRYGMMAVNGKPISAHRFSYNLHKGPVPDGLEIDHLCHTPLCVNPSHLEAVTRSENNKRAYRRSFHLMQIGWRERRTHLGKPTKHGDRQ
jgi:hypothetical protein